MMTTQILFNLGVFILIPTIAIVLTQETKTSQDELDDFHAECSNHTTLCFGLQGSTIVAFTDKTCVDHKETCNALIISYNDSTEQITFKMLSEMSSPDENFYFSLGLSKDTKMDDDFVVYCYRLKNGSAVALLAENRGRRSFLLNADLQKQMISKEESTHDKSLLCKVTLPSKLSTSTPGSVDFDLIKNKYHIMLAKGTLNEGRLDEVREQHSDRAVNELSTNVTRGERQGVKNGSNNDIPISVTIHIIGMILAFTFFIPTGLFISRYYKETWSTERFCRRRKWLTYHIGCLLCGFMSAITASIMLSTDSEEFDFKEFGPTDQRAGTHFVIGMVVMSFFLYLCTTNWIRPYNSNMRGILSLIHAFMGNVCYFLGNLLILMSTEWTKQNDSNAQICPGKFAVVAFGVMSYVIFNLFMASYVAWTDLHLDVKGYRSFLKCPLPLVSNEEAPRPKFRKLILGIYACLNLIISIIGIILYLYFNETCQSRF